MWTRWPGIGVLPRTLVSSHWAGSSLALMPTAYQCLTLRPCDQRREPSQALLGTLVQR